MNQSLSSLLKFQVLLSEQAGSFIALYFYHLFLSIRNHVYLPCRLVDSRDIMELQLKQLDCEVLIRKREALPQPPPPGPVTLMHSHVQSGAPQAQPVPAPAPALAPAAPTPSTSSAVKSAKSSLPPLKCPMAGTFYRSAAPGEPPFVKVNLFYLVIYLDFNMMLSDQQNIFAVLSFCFLGLFVLNEEFLLGWRQGTEGAGLMHH